ncbi:tetratricopeptide repeat protein [Helicobacter labetoulli]|uniref:tetratricopeptide repeat protein n=1 Tax=Helicobacter labetoulli TaxID=2315333 RepID=UPI000EF74AE9|nr:hypothetical protein [Helicobacter labetoulli]
MKKPYLFLLLFPFFCLAEPSAFEKQSGATKNDLKALQSVVTKLQQKVETIQQAQEGILSFHESQSSKIQQQLIQATQNAKDIEELKTQTELYKKLQQQVETNTQNITLLKTQIQELNTSLKTLNQTILDELKKLNTTPTQDESNVTNVDSAKSVAFTKDKAKKAEIFTQAQDLFKKTEYDSAKARFEWLLTLNYKKAENHFYLGEIAFINKAHNDAIYHYKQSALANDRAKYMPTLLLHTAQSFNAIKDTKNYNKFLDSLISNYPTSKEAQNAKKLKEKKDKK